MAELTKIANGNLLAPRKFRKFFDDFDYPFMFDFFKDDFKGNFIPKLDVSEDHNNLLIRVELPGVEKKDIKLSLNDYMLTISGEKKKEMEEDEENFYKLERSYGTFSRTITLPMEVKHDKIDAIFKDGVLNITLPKTEEMRRKEKFIDIK